MNTRVDKVANAPPPSMSQGWPVPDTPHAGNQGGTLGAATGAADTRAGAGVSEEQLVRHNVADPPRSSPPVHLTGSLGRPAGSKQSFRLQPVLQSNAVASDSDDPGPTSGSKTASFYIGGDESASPQVHKKLQAASGSPWKVSGGGKAVLEFTPPDGGYGWVVALVACFINLWIVGFTKSYGILHVAISEAFPEASAYHIAWMPSLLSTVGLLTAPVTGIMCRRFTSRKVSFFGGFLCFLGLLLASVATSVNQLIVSVGLLVGLGSGITTTSGILVVYLYFERRRTFASSICLSGNALGGFFLPPLVDYLLKTYGLRGAFLILAALQLHICAASILFRPISHHAIVQAAELHKKALADTAKDKLIPSVTASSPIRHSSPSRLRLLWWRMRRRFISVESVKESELHHQVSFLRSATMMNSVPNLPLYARSWSVSGGPTFPDSRPSFNIGSRSSLTNQSPSKWSLTKFPLFQEHPSVLRLSYEDQSTGRSSPVHLHQHGGSQRSFSPRVLGSGVDRRSSLTRQTSIRTIHSRIMASVLEQDKEDIEGFLRDCGEMQKCVVKCKQIIKEEKENGNTVEENLEFGDERKEQEEEDSQKIAGKARCCGECLRGLCDTSLFRDGLFWVMAISVSLIAWGTPFAMIYLPSYAESVSIPSSVTTAMMSASSVADLIGRLLTGFVSDLGLCQLYYIYFFSSLAAGSATLILPHVTGTVGLTVVLCVLGFCVGSWFVMIPAMLAAHHGASKLAASYGMVRLFNGIMNFISPQAVGMMFDATQSYQAVYTLMGCNMVTGSSLVLLSPLLHRHNKNNNSSATENENDKSTKKNPDDNTV